MMDILPYSEKLYSDVMHHQIEYMQTGWTICGAEDPAVIEIADSFSITYPELKGLTFVRVIDKYVGPNRSETLLEFSSKNFTPEEYAAYDTITADY